MCIYNKLPIFIAILAMLVLPLFATYADARHQTHYRYHRQHAAPKHYYPSTRLSPDGDIIDRNGWRYRPGYGWDNTCFNINYLPSSIACGAGGGRK
jgi:hypothetical protein